MRVRTRVKKLLLAALAIFAILASAILLAGWLLTKPMPESIGNAPPDLGAQAVAFESESGATIHAWWCPVAGSRGAVLLLPGIRANRLSMIERARFLRRASYSTLLIDFQATGESTGDHITFGWKESRDVLAAVDFIRQAEPSSRVAIIGSSLGGAAALFATPPLKVDALILESVYPSIERALKNRLTKYLGAPGKFLAPLLLWQLQPRFKISPSQLRPIDHIAAVSAPVLIMSGEKDRNTTPDDTQLLFAQAKEPKEIWMLPKAGHVDLHLAARSEYETRVRSFLERAFAAGHLQ